MADLVLHLVLFTAAGSLMVASPMLIGKLVRPNKPTPEKDAVYECGEPTIGSSFIQFDLRFYTVALLFIVFDVEVAFFFPWATVYGTAIQLTDQRLSEPARQLLSEKLLNYAPGTLPAAEVISSETALQLGWLAFADIFVFFAVLLVGFAYVWKRGDLEWIKAMPTDRRKDLPATESTQEPELVH